MLANFLIVCQVSTLYDSNAGSNLIKLATFIRYISSHFEYDGDLVIDKKKNDWEKIKRRKTSRTGRVLKPPIIWNV